MKLRDPDEQSSRARDLTVAALGFTFVLAADCIACALAPAERRETPQAPCVLDAQKGAAP